jgi:hypothetical protein
MRNRALHLKLIDWARCPCCHGIPFEHNPWVTSPIHGLTVCHQCNEADVQNTIKRCEEPKR